MKNYCVTYLYYGIHYKYRCRASSRSKAKKFCKEYMGNNVEIIDVEVEK